MNIVVTVALMPALFTEPPASDETVTVASGATLDTRPVAATLVREHRRATTLRGTPASTTTSTKVAPAPTTTTPPTTAAPTPRPKPQPTVRAASAPTTTTTAAPKPKPKPAPTTTTTATKPKPRPTTTTAPPAPSSSSERTESGKASWYDHQPGICAHKTLPMGTVVTVTSTANGKSTTCEVGDRGPFVEGWIIDLHPEQFEQLAPRSTGVIAVRISW